MEFPSGRVREQQVHTQISRGEQGHRAIAEVISFASPPSFYQAALFGMCTALGQGEPVKQPLSSSCNGPRHKHCSQQHRPTATLLQGGEEYTDSKAACAEK